MAVGKAEQRLDAQAKVSGRARYTDDLGIPGMLHAVYVRSPHAHARVLRIDSHKALALSGVEAVFTAQDVPQNPYPTAGHPYSLDPLRADVADRLLLTAHARYCGDEVAIVLARDVLTARRAAELVEVVYEILPAVLDATAALEDSAPYVHPELQSSNLLAESALNFGSPLEEVFADADLYVEGLYSTQRVLHCHLECHTAYAWMDDLSRINIVSSTQIPHICRRIVGQALGIDWGQVRVIKPYIGGGFGNKQDVLVEPMVAFLAQRLGRPVSLALSREECMATTRTRHPFTIQGKAGFSADGSLRGFSLDVLSDTGAYASHGHAIAAAGGSKVVYLYPRAAYGFHARTVYTNNPIAGAMRGYGSPQVHFALDCMMEQAARALGVDSVDFRCKNVGSPHDINPLTHSVFTSHGLLECLEKGRKRFRWDERKAQAIRTGKLRRGVGVACFSYSTGTYPVSVEEAGIRMILNQDASIMLHAGATEIGQGADTVFAQMAAQSLGVEFSRLRVQSTQDTDHSPFDTGAYASRQTYIAGNAVHPCALLLRERILHHAAVMLNRDPVTLSLCPSGIVALSAPDSPLLRLEEVALDSYYHKERGQPLVAEYSHKTCANAPSLGCTFVELEVDIPLCRVRITAMLNVHDAGTIINPQLATGQVHGGMAMGAGYALSEEMIIDPRTGVPRTDNFLDYKIPTFMDMPDFDCDFVQTFEPTSSYGSKALGEPPIVSPAPAIRNALWDATGVQINAIPLTPKVLFKYFKAAGLLEG